MQQTYTVNEYREEPEDKKKRKKKKKDSLEGGLQVDLKGPNVELGRIYSFMNRFFKKKKTLQKVEKIPILESR